MVKHFLKDGSQVESIEGYVLKQKDFPGLYSTLDQIEKRMIQEEKKKKNDCA